MIAARGGHESKRQPPLAAQRVDIHEPAHVPAGCDVYSQSARGGEYLRIVLEGGTADRGRNERFSNIVDARAIQHDLAASLGLSAGFFSRAFREAVGKAPHDYIIDRRVARAGRLLQSNARDLAAVAQATGFSSHAHMASVFRKRLGTTPSIIRGTCMG